MGVVYGAGLAAAFWAVINIAHAMYTDSVVRVIFGVIAIVMFFRLYKSALTDVINFRNVKPALFASAGVLLATLVDALILITGARGFIDIPVPLFLCDVFLQQIAVGFFEEMVFRALMLEDYFSHGDRTWKRRLCYALISFVIFGFIHAMVQNTWADAVLSFLFTGAFGFTLAAAYLHSHNILVPMLLHFVYDAVLHSFHYVSEWTAFAMKARESLVLTGVLIAAMIAASVYFLIKPSVDDAVDLEPATEQ